MVGGRTNHWGRISLRFGPDDFRHKSLDGLGDDWPIGYDDLKPYRGFGEEALVVVSPSFGEGCESRGDARPM